MYLLGGNRHKVFFGIKTNGQSYHLEQQKGCHSMGKTMLRSLALVLLMFLFSTGLTEAQQKEHFRWSQLLGLSPDSVQRFLGEEFECSTEPLEVRLPVAWTANSIRDSYWSPVEGNWLSDPPEVASSSGLQRLTCRARGSLLGEFLYWQSDDEVFRVDVFYERENCVLRETLGCNLNSIEPKQFDETLFGKVNEPYAYSLISERKIAGEYIRRYQDFFADNQLRRLVFWSDCAHPNGVMFLAVNSLGLKQRCIVEATLVDGVWSSTSFYEFLKTGILGDKTVATIVAHQTATNIELDRVYMTKYHEHFEELADDNIGTSSTKPSTLDKILGAQP
jgi:hypothetical protein